MVALGKKNSGLVPCAYSVWLRRANVFLEDIRYKQTEPRESVVVKMTASISGQRVVEVLLRLIQKHRLSRCLEQIALLLPRCH